MEASYLTPGLQGLESLDVLDEASISLAREFVRRVGNEVQLPHTATESIATATSELVRNQLSHARKGRVYARAIQRAGVQGVEVIAVDEGKGISEPGPALQGIARNHRGLGSGLAGAARLSDELDCDVRRDEGTCIRARKFAGPVPFRSEVAIVARSCEEGWVNGDDGAFLRMGDDDLVFVVADGLGHGSLAREASELAVSIVVDHPCVPPEQLVRDCDVALSGTRGAVMAVARLNRAGMNLEHASLGNVTTQVVRLRQSRRFSSPSGIVGASESRTKRIGTDTAEIQPGDVTLMYTDGLKSAIDLSMQFELLREHPLVIADYLLTHFGRPDDDALVLVAR